MLQKKLIPKTELIIFSLISFLARSPMPLESGLALQDVADHLGHSSFEITSKYYLHITKKHKHESVEKMMHYLEN
ncbi:hypothetical protein EGCR1_16795 (plasmid) [Enterococcus gilvus]|jgi:integrase|uniref:hypothetical protein n=1 Tax=Enterococcus gilvus TaxID=160453 RepID=UPI000DF60DF5|nr:hypothetical protein [Enterococcus gilvus]AXG40366.1 hypothetical protein EGCR1_16795 [Enterococcus gilvus]